MVDTLKALAEIAKLDAKLYESAFAKVDVCDGFAAGCNNVFPGARVYIRMPIPAPILNLRNCSVSVLDVRNAAVPFTLILSGPQI